MGHRGLEPRTVSLKGSYATNCVSDPTCPLRELRVQDSNLGYTGQNRVYCLYTNSHSAKMKVFGTPGGILCTGLNYDQHHGASPISQGLIRTAISTLD